LTKPKVSKWKGLIKIKTKINEMFTKENQYKESMKQRVVFFQKDEQD
jgi:hypothetical protein